MSLDHADSGNGGAIVLQMVSFANVTRCHFTSNHASTNGGAIFVAVKSELNVSDSQFTLNTATKGGSLGFLESNSLIESCAFASDSSLEEGGCMNLEAAHVTVRRSSLTGSGSRCGTSMVKVLEQSSLTVETVIITDSCSHGDGGAFRVSDNSDLFMRDAVITSCRSEGFGRAIYCSGTSRMLLESAMISSCSSSLRGILDSYTCNITMDNVTITNTISGHAITADESNIDIFNSRVQSSETATLNSSTHNSVSWSIIRDSTIFSWNFELNGTGIKLFRSRAEFRHTSFVNVDHECLIKAEDENTITLKSVYFVSPTGGNKSWNGIACKDSDTVVYGSLSGRT